MRVFIALDLPQDLKKTLQQCIASLKARGFQARWTNIDNLHLTLAFLGEVESVEPVKEVLSSIPFPDCFLELERSELFRDILVVKAKAGESLLEYVRILKEALEKAGISFDHKAFKPHITLARKFKETNPKLIFNQKVYFDQVTLFQSTLTPDGPIYTPLAVIKAENKN